MSDSTNDQIEVSGARVHNLKNIDVSIPKNKQYDKYSNIIIYRTFIL